MKRLLLIFLMMVLIVGCGRKQAAEQTKASAPPQALPVLDQNNIYKTNTQTPAAAPDYSFQESSPDTLQPLPDSLKERANQD